MTQEKLFFTVVTVPSNETEQPRSVALIGREAWAMLELVEAGATGCTPITHPGPRWSDYVFRLRKHGFRVETINEKHGGAFAGSHARYVLHDAVRLDGGNLAAWRPNGVRYPSSMRAAA